MFMKVCTTLYVKLTLSCHIPHGLYNVWFASNPKCLGFKIPFLKLQKQKQIQFILLEADRWTTVKKHTHG